MKDARPILNKYWVKAAVYPVFKDLGKKNIVFEENTNKTPIDMLTEQQFRQLASEGFEIRSHCMYHVHLGRRKKQEITYELSESKNDSEKTLGKSS
ncbi:MAG: polysaccharide deacetylase family protein [Cytophagales bacterium]|nr:polysaccharide deacetylase family protein [Cytophagales bacterium]